jgi:hypothetical protein
MISALITLILYLLIVGLLWWLVMYVIDAIPIPDPPARVIKIAMMVLLVLIIIALIVNLFGLSTGGMNLPKISVQ